ERSLKDVGPPHLGVCDPTMGGTWPREDAEMIAFSEVVDPFKPCHRASESLRFVQHSPILDSDVEETELQRISSLPSTADRHSLARKRTSHQCRRARFEQLANSFVQATLLL